MNISINTQIISATQHKETTLLSMWTLDRLVGAKIIKKEIKMRCPGQTILQYKFRTRFLGRAKGFVCYRWTSLRKKIKTKNKPMTTSVYFVLLIPITIDKNLVHVCSYHWYSGIIILPSGPRKQIIESNYPYYTTTSEISAIWLA